MLLFGAECCGDGVVVGVFLFDDLGGGDGEGFVDEDVVDGEVHQVLVECPIVAPWSCFGERAVEVVAFDGVEYVGLWNVVEVAADDAWVGRLVYVFADCFCLL